MKRSNWTEKRLMRLFQRYNSLYWDGKLPSYRIIVQTMPEFMGQCQSNRRKIAIDVEKHANDSQVRATLLHEMAHAAGNKRGSRGHDVMFFAQLEKLLQRGAPVSISVAEAGGVRMLANLVPSRFPLLKRKMDYEEARREKVVEKLIAELNLGAPEQVTTDSIFNRFEDAASQFTWQQAVRAVGPEFGLTDEVGRALTPSARRVLKGAKNAHRRARSIHLSGERLQAAYRAQVMDQSRLNAIKKLEEVRQAAITTQEAPKSTADEAVEGMRQ